MLMIEDTPKNPLIHHHSSPLDRAPQKSMITPNKMPDWSHLSDDSDPSLIPGLPDDVSILCLARVPRRLHNLLKCVSKRWKELVSSEEFLLCRRQNRLQEAWIYAFCKDSSRRNRCYVLDPDSPKRAWKPLPFMPSSCLKRDGMSCESVGRKLFLLGGSSWNQDTMDEVYCYDASTNTWEKASSMPRPRCYFATATVGDKLYTVDGDVMSPVVFQSWDAYDTVADKWASLEDTRVGTYIRKAIVVDSKIYTIHNNQQGTPYAGVYDTVARTWTFDLSSDMAFCWRGPTVVVDGSPYMLDEGLGMKLSKWQSGHWVPVGRLSSLLTEPQCELAVVGRRIFVVGKGLRTITVDVDVAVEGGRMLVSSPPMPGLDDDLIVMSCKTIAM